MRAKIFCISLFVLCLAAPAAGAGWSVLNEAGVRWLDMPGGVRFYAKGVNTVNGGQDTDKAKKNQAYYWARFYEGKSQWAADVRERLRAWGFNSLGGWSDPAPELGLPITPEIDLGRNARLHWFDPFAPDAADVALKKALALTEKYRGDPRVIGYFTDNETGWWNAPLFSWYLQNDWAIYAKRALWEQLVVHYRGNWSRLIADFVPGEGIASFEDLKRGGAVLKLRPGGQGIRFIDRFMRLCASRYYRIVHDAVKKADPEALVLGDRLPLYYHQEAVLAARGLVDVLSTNYNVDCEDGWVAPYYFEGLNALISAPVLVTEFFFAAEENNSGNSNNGHLMHVGTQEERARGAAAAMRNFASFPNVAGAHWFQYYDEPTGGRGDGEDFNMGLVDVWNIPYRELVQSVKAVNDDLERVHARSRWNDIRGAPAVARKASAPISLTDNSLLDWPDKAGTRLLGFTASPAPYVPFGDVHLAWDEKGLYFFNLAGNYADLHLLSYEGEFPLSETYQIHVEVETAAGPRHFAVHLSPRPHEKYEGRFELKPGLYEYGPDGSARPLDGTGLLQALDKPLPHIAVEFSLPASLLGLPRLQEGMRLGLRVRVTNFYREMEMRYDGGALTLHGDAAG